MCVKTDCNTREKYGSDEKSIARDQVFLRLTKTYLNFQNIVDLPLKATFGVNDPNTTVKVKPEYILLSIIHFTEQKEFVLLVCNP